MGGGGFGGQIADSSSSPQGKANYKPSEYGSLYYKHELIGVKYVACIEGFHPVMVPSIVFAPVPHEGNFPPPRHPLWWWWGMADLYSKTGKMAPIWVALGL